MRYLLDPANKNPSKLEKLVDKFERESLAKGTDITELSDILGSIVGYYVTKRRLRKLGATPLQAYVITQALYIARELYITQRTIKRIQIIRAWARIQQQTKTKERPKFPSGTGFSGARGSGGGRVEPA